MIGKYGYTKDIEEVLEESNNKDLQNLANSFSEEQIKDMQGALEKFYDYSYEDVSEEELRGAVISDYFVTGLCDAAVDRDRQRFYNALELYIRYCL